MIAIVSSTIQPLANPGQTISFYTFEERIEQTKQTLTALRRCGFTKIFLVDNSPLLARGQIQSVLAGFPELEVHHLLQYQFQNKGINELLMLLYMVAYLPANKNIFKISGRYCPDPSFVKPEFNDFAIKGYRYHSKLGTISTRGYWVKDTEVMHRFLLGSLNEIFSYPRRIVGLRSLYNKMKGVLGKHPPLINISIEFAAANTLKRENYRVTLLDHLGIEGYIAGADKMERITE